MIIHDTGSEQSERTPLFSFRSIINDCARFLQVDEKSKEGKKQGEDSMGRSSRFEAIRERGQ